MRRSHRGIAPVLFAALLLAAPAAAAGPVQIQQVLDLVAAGVGEPIILKQVAAAGPAFSVGIDEVLALKRAGASDALIDGLMDLAGDPPPPAPPREDEPSFRITREVGEDGRTVIHITNLDASGRRMGGPVPDGPPAPRNAYLSRHEEVPPSEGREEGAGAGEAGTVPPVTVNVFNINDEPVAVTESDPYDRPYLGGYLPVAYGRGVRGAFGYGFRSRLPFGVPSPPGSYTHYKRYHAGDSKGHGRLYNGGLQHRALKQQGYALPVPFHTAGAARLNQLRSRVRLGHPSP